ADISGSQFLKPDGNFPNHMPNPEDKAAIKSVIEATLRNHADLGLIFDTDVDRAGAVDCDGNEICKNSLIALASKIALKNNFGGTVVTDSVTSDGLHDYIESELHGVHDRFKRGYKNVINEAKRLNSQGINCPLAIETSGHAALRENYFLDDGAYLVTKIVIELVNLRRQDKNFSDILNKLKKPIESVEFRLKILCEDFKIYGEKVINDLFTYAKNRNGWEIASDNKEGIRISFDKTIGNGWLLLRLSVHDPVMPLNIESNEMGGIKLILQNLEGFMKKYNYLDLSSMNEKL
ncbi:MAG: phosphomannomutase/phosphoglucomutase, partial [Bacilli bacterium]